MSPGRPPLVLTALIALVAWWGITAPGSAYAQRSPVTIEHAGRDTITVAPADRGSVAFRILNQGRVSLHLRLLPDAPQTWRMTALPDLALEPDSSAVRVVSFFLPPDAPAGVHELGLVARYDGGRAEGRVFVRVPANPELQAAVVEAPAWATAEESYAVRFRIGNTGNTPLTYQMRLVSPYAFRTHSDTTSGRLEPGEFVEPWVLVTPPEDLGRAVVHALRMIVVAGRDSAEAVARVEVLPQGQDARSERGGIPAELRLRASPDPRAGPPLRAHAAGPLRPGSRTRIEVLLQGPTEGYSVFGETDVYRVRLESPRFSIGAGDDVYRLSRLTEPGQEGLGFGATVHGGPVEAGGFFQHDRRSFQPDTQYAAFAGVSLGRPLELRGNWFRRDSRRGSREVLSAEATLRVPGWVSVEGEYGWRTGSDAAARIIDLSGRRGSLTLGVRHIRADRAFGGIYGGLSLDAANVGLRPWRALYLEGSVEDQSVQPGPAGLFFDQSRRSARVAVGWGSTISLEGHHLERSSRSGSADADREARSIRLRIGLPLGPVRLYPTAEAGIGQDRLTSWKESFWRAGLRAQMNTGPVSFSTTADYFTGGTLHRLVAEEGLSGAASASLRLGSSFQLHASAYGTRYLAPSERISLVVNGSAEQRLPFGHVISARVLTRTSSGFVQHRETTAVLDYTIPLNLPVGRTPESASVVGKIVDAETGQPLSGIIVRLGGRRIITDGSGRVTLRGLEAGTHYLEIDRSTIGPGRVPTTPMPRRLEVRSGRRTEFEVRMARAGGLDVLVGLVRSTSVSDWQATAQAEAMERVLLEFRRGNERFRRPTDQRGRVELRELRPGRWLVTVVNADLPAFHRFEDDSASIQVEPGERTQLELIARPVERRIQIVATGQLREEPVEEQEESVNGGGEAVAGSDESRIFHVPMTMPLWEVAWLVYRESTLWPKIWLANRKRVPDPAAAQRHLELRIPPKTPLNEAETRAREERRKQLSAPRSEPTTFRVPMDMPLWEVAWRVYGDTDLWPKIWLANRELIPDPSAARIDLLLEIPPGGPLTPAERRADQEYRERDVLSLPPRLRRDPLRP